MNATIKLSLVLWCVCGWICASEGANIYFPIPVDDGSAARAAAVQRAKIGAAFEIKYGIEAYQAQMKKALAVEPWREINGVTNSIFGEGWFHVCGTVIKVMTNGVLVDGYILPLAKIDVDHRQFVLVRFPYDVGDNDSLEFTKYYMAKSSGTVILPDGAVLHKYDYGRVCAPAPEYIAALIAKDAKARQVAAAATLKLDQEKAQEGNAMYQYRLGMRYQTGNGVGMDRDKARQWLRKASAQGYEEARIALLNLDSPEADASTNGAATGP